VSLSSLFFPAKEEKKDTRRHFQVSFQRFSPSSPPFYLAIPPHRHPSIHPHHPSLPQPITFIRSLSSEEIVACRGGEAGKGGRAGKRGCLWGGRDGGGVVVIVIWGVGGFWGGGKGRGEVGRWVILYKNIDTPSPSPFLYSCILVFFLSFFPFFRFLSYSLVSSPPSPSPSLTLPLPLPLPTPTLNPKPQTQTT